MKIYQKMNIENTTIDRFLEYAIIMINNGYEFAIEDGEIYIISSLIE